MSRVRTGGSRALDVLQDAVGLWTSRNAFQHAGALSFYTLGSMAPLLVILITIIGAVFGEDAARGEIASYVDSYIGSEAARLVENAVLESRVEQAGLMPTVLGVGALVFASTTVFAQMQSSLNDLWGVAARPSRSGIVVFLMTRLESLGLVLVIGFLLLTSFVLSTAVTAVRQFAEGWMPIPPALMTLADAGVSLLLATLLFAMIFKILPDVELHWRDMWQGAFITALLFVGGQSLITLYLARTAPASPYGAAGSLVVLLLWVYYSALILFFGAALTRAAIRVRGSHIVPKPTAVRVRMEVLEEQPEGHMAKVKDVD